MQLRLSSAPGWSAFRHGPDIKAVERNAPMDTFVREAVIEDTGRFLRGYPTGRPPIRSAEKERLCRGVRRTNWSLEVGETSKSCFGVVRAKFSFQGGYLHLPCPSCVSYKYLPAPASFEDERKVLCAFRDLYCHQSMQHSATLFPWRAIYRFCAALARGSSTISLGELLGGATKVR